MARQCPPLSPLGELGHDLLVSNQTNEDVMSRNNSRDVDTSKSWVSETEHIKGEGATLWSWACVRRSAVKMGYTGRTALGAISKRAIDVTFATLAIVLLAPLLFAASVLVRVLIGGPIVLAERKVGLGGKVFAQYTFRTTPADGAPANSWVEAVADGLRASGIDKLPQLFNVIRGDMSLMGPDRLLRKWCVDAAIAAKPAPDLHDAAGQASAIHEGSA